jgi:hypothetical protein
MSSQSWWYILQIAFDFFAYWVFKIILQWIFFTFILKKRMWYVMS